MEDNKLRRYITGIRCSYNYFPINVLRKQGVDRQLRFCTLCETGEISSELHVTILCTNQEIISIRNELVSILKLISPQILQLTNDQLFYYLVQAIDLDVKFYFAIFLDKVYKVMKIK